jgi:hypothetical protein
MMGTYLADTIRAIASSGDRLALRRLFDIADQVQRMEVCVDQIVGQAEAHMITRPMPRRRGERRP